MAFWQIWTAPVLTHQAAGISIYLRIQDLLNSLFEEVSGPLEP